MRAAHESAAAARSITCAIRASGAPHRRFSCAVSPNAPKVAVLFTYGPLAYLFYPFDFGHHVVAALVFRLSLNALAAVLVLRMLLAAGPSARRAGLVGATVLAAVGLLALTVGFRPRTRVRAGLAGAGRPPSGSDQAHARRGVLVDGDRVRLARVARTTSLRSEPDHGRRRAGARLPSSGPRQDRAGPERRGQGSDRLDNGSRPTGTEPTSRPCRSGSSAGPRPRLAASEHGAFTQAPGRWRVAGTRRRPRSPCGRDRATRPDAGPAGRPAPPSRAPGVRGRR